jgi:hypothetical protein
VTVIGEAGKGSDGRRYVYTREGAGAIPFDEIVYPQAESDLKNDYSNCPTCGAEGPRFTDCPECGDQIR